MSLARWHTPTPPPPAARPVPKPVATTISRDRLAALMRQHHYLDKELKELDILAEYREKFPTRWTRDMDMRPQRYIYQMMAELMTDAEVDQVYKELTPTKTTEPPPDYQHGSESARDHLGADNIIRHMHRNPPSPYNQGPPVGKDPYLGTGLNPAHVSGVMSPNDGLAPEMACCGQPLGSKGCWIRLVDGQPIGELTRYQTWFTQNDVEAANIWQRIALKGTEETLKRYTVTGTAFIKQDYYRDLDRQIRRLIDEVAPKVLGVYTRFISAGFSQKSGVSQLLADTKKKLIKLIALVQRYNAPQMGACHHERTIDDAYLDEHVFFVRVGREEFRQKRLVDQVSFGGGVEVPLITGGPTNEGFVNTTKALTDAGVSKAIRAEFLRAAGLIAEVQEEQQLLEERRRVFDDADKKIRAVFLSVGLPNVWNTRLVEGKSVYEDADALTKELENLLNALPEIANNWIRAGNKDSEPAALSAKLKEIVDNQRKLRLLIIPDEANLEEFADILEFDTSEVQATIAANEELKNFAQLPVVQAWARATVVASRLTNPPAEIQEALERLYDVALQATVVPAQPVPPPPPSSTPLSLGARTLVNLEPFTIRDPVVPTPDRPLIGGVGYKYDNLSCSFDTLFAALFKIPNQWVRQKIATAKQVFAYDSCIDKVNEVQLHMIQVIEYMEGSRTTPTVCPTMDWWQDCMKTRQRGQEASRVDDPAEMLSAIAGFYGFQGSVLTNYMESVDRFSNFSNPAPPNDETQLILVQLFRPGTSFPRLYPSIPTTSPDGKFTITACIVHSESKGHWQVCIRDPRTQNWFRFGDDGKPYSLGQDPVDIKAQSVEPGKSPNDFKYQPVYWFYVRTSMLAPLLPNFEIDNNTFLNATSSREIVQLFGRADATRNAGRPLTKVDGIEFVQNPIIGITQILYLLDNSRGLEGKVASLGWTWPFSVEKVNQILIPPLRKMFGSLMVEGKSIAYTLKDFTPVARLVKLFVTKGSGEIVVPEWKNTDIEEQGVLSVPQNWFNVGRSNDYFQRIGQLWGLALIYLILLLSRKNDDTITDTSLTGEFKKIQDKAQALQNEFVAL